MKIIIFLSSFLATAVSHHIPGHLGQTDNVLLVVPGVHGVGEGYVLRDGNVHETGISGVFIPDTKVQEGLILTQELPGAGLVSLDDPVHQLRRRRATGFSYTAPDGTSRSERVDTYVDPRVKDHHPLTRVTGRVSWTSPEGIPITMNYVADGSGYHVLPSRR